MEIKLNLIVEEVNILLHGLHQLPYGQVVELVKKIHEQAGNQNESPAN